VVLYGKNNTVEHCSFVHKESPGALLLVELSYNDEVEAVGHKIKNNYFFDYAYRDPDTQHSGDSETIRIGGSAYQSKNAKVTVENNYFQACDGENEIITNKSSNNIYKYNTFRKCRGSLVLRHGANAWVEGNYFLGENKKHSGGIRVSDSFHTIINNYFQDLNNDGNKWNNAITLVGGSAKTGGSSNGYQKVDEILVAYNTVYNCDNPLFFNDRSSHDPTGVFAYNLLHSNSTNIINGDIEGTGQGIDYTDNRVNGAKVGLSHPGVTLTDIDFIKEGEIFKPSKATATAKAPGGLVLTEVERLYADKVKLDIEGRIRPNNKLTVGAHGVIKTEVSEDKVLESEKNVTKRVFTDEDVHLLVGASFIDAEGNLIETK